MAVRFTRTSSEYWSLTSSLPAGSSDWTWMAWVYPVSYHSSNYSAVFSPRINSVDCEFAFNAGSGARNIALWNGTTEQLSAGTYASGAWYHLALTKSGGTVTAYVNGTQVVQQTGGTAWPNTGTTGGYYVGEWSGTGDYFDGRMAAMKMWTRALTAAELANEINVIRPADATNLWGWWPVIETGAGSRNLDYGGSARNWTETNTPSDEDPPPVSWGAPISMPQIAAASGTATADTATGAATTAATGSSTALTTAGTAAGAATTTATGASTAVATADVAAGVATTAATGAATTTATAGTAAGAATTGATGTSTAVATASSAAGVATTSATGSSTATATADTAAGSATVVATAVSGASTADVAAGVATTAATGSSTAQATANTAVGTATTSATGASSAVATADTAGGSATVAASAITGASTANVAAGVATTAAIGSSIVVATADASAGTATTTAVGSSIAVALANVAAGVATVIARAQALLVAIERAYRADPHAWIMRAADDAWIFLVVLDVTVMRATAPPFIMIVAALPATREA